MAEARRRRANGAASRERILDAAAEIAGERGYEGTSINLISERSGLPPSSLYWHFSDKDELIAAVIDRSFGQWNAALAAPLAVPEDATVETQFREQMQRTGAAIAEFSDFLRLGLMLILERRPEEPTARRKFLEVRRAATDGARSLYETVFGDLADADVDALVTLTIALADGLFVAQETGEVDLRAGFDLLATTVLATADRFRRTGQAQHEQSRRPSRR